MPKDTPVDFNEDMTGIVFDGERYDIPGMDMIFYAVYQRGASSREVLKELLIKEIKRAGIDYPKDKEEEFGFALVKKYRMTMQRGGGEV